MRLTNKIANMKALRKRCSVILAAALVEGHGWRHPSPAQVTDTGAWQDTLGGSGTKTRSWEEKTVSLLEGRREAVVLETKRENPKGKIRGITIVGKEAITYVAGTKNTPWVNVRHFLLHSCRWVCPEMALLGRSASPLGEEQYHRGSWYNKSVTDPFVGAGWSGEWSAGHTFQPILSCHWSHL